MTELTEDEAHLLSVLRRYRIKQHTGMTVRELADKVGDPPAKVRSRLKALEKLGMVWTYGVAQAASPVWHSEPPDA